MKNIILNNQTYSIPDNFDWKSYIARYDDLRIAGIDNEQKAIIHYVLYGKKENRLYEKLKISDIENIINMDKKDETKHLLYTSASPIHFVVSVLFFYPENKSINFIKHAPKLIIQELLKINSSNQITFVIKNNSLNHNQNIIEEHLNAVKKQFNNNKNINIVYKDGYNNGFSAGHNSNLLPYKNADLVLCLNDDLGFPNAHWLREALYVFDNNKEIGIIGAKQSPQYIQNLFAFGNDRNLYLRPNPDYAEGSILLCRGDLFRKLNGFDTKFEYFYFEDVDLCLRAKQLGFNIANISIPHQHFRSDSTQKIPPPVKTSIIEHNRSQFLRKWSKYLTNNRHTMTNNILISLKADGFGDLVDCFFPVQSLINEHQFNNIDIYISNNKTDCIYNFFNKPILHEFPDLKNYDTVYDIDDLNLSPPFSTLDLIAAKLGVNNFSTEANNIRKFILSNVKTKLRLHEKEYIVLHLDSQREGFEGRMPNQNIFISLIKYLLSIKKSIILVGQPLSNYNTESQNFEQYIKSLSKNSAFIDNRENATSTDIIRMMVEAELFIGLDSGPSHVAQLLNIPSYIIYGPINPLSKIYRYENSGCWFNLNDDSLSGSYHKNLFPSYHYDLRRDKACINIDEQELVDSVGKFIDNNFHFNWIPIYEKFRNLQRQFLSIQFHNPIYRNKILDGSVNSTNDADLFVRVLNLYEEHAINLIKNKI